MENYLLTHSIHISGEKKVGQGKVSMQNSMGVKIQHPINHLLHHLASFLLHQNAVLCSQVTLKLAVVSNLQHQINIVGVLKVVVKLQEKNTRFRDAPDIEELFIYKQIFLMKYSA